ncbi:hypothetical protein JOC54_001244 [Alkalihalobacillus xiaoxiensis]|uniref:Uncharacterized protein n=1 Tax=Shouchella xiaoxiensis TaxID=766895 RepID=A0ABS2SR66_9BACI|nr:hypothetical protein [Shouchella xiaoxiensis]MBM7838013.1 hypothetical protein [Shouchella xiaoxiensis]
MEALVTQRCIEVTQEIGILEKRVVETSFELQLFEDRIQVQDDYFPLTSVFDISFRFPSQSENSLGFLYLHTSQGVSTFKIKSKPETLIKEFKKLVPETKFRSDL